MNRRRTLLLLAAALPGLAASRRLFAASGDDSDLHPLLGKRAPNFEVLDSGNTRRQLSDFKGKTLVLEWTSPSCEFSRAQYQSGVMQELQRSATQQGVIWLTVMSAHPSRSDYLPPAKAEAFNRKRGGAPTAVLMDSQGAVGKAYGAVVTPHMFVVASDGRLAYAGAPGTVATADPKRVKASRSLVRAALDDLAAGRKVATPGSRPFGCVIAYRG